MASIMESVWLQIAQRKNLQQIVWFHCRHTNCQLPSLRDSVVSICTLFVDISDDKSIIACPNAPGSRFKIQDSKKVYLTNV